MSNGDKLCIVNTQVISDFCKCVDKMSSSSDKFIFVSFDHEVLGMYAYSSTFIVVMNTRATGEGKLFVGVNLHKFVQSFKILGGGDTTLRMKNNDLVIDNNNTVVKLGTAEYHDLSSSFSKFDHISGECKDWMIDNIIKCDIQSKFKDEIGGIVIDNRDILRVSKISNTFIRIISYDGVGPDKKFRVVIPHTIVKLMSTFRDIIDEVIISNDKIGIKMSNGITVMTPLLYDKYPENYITSLGLRNELSLIDEGKYDRYLFSKSDLQGAINTVSSVIGDDESFVIMECIGVDKVNKFPAWNVMGKSSSKCSVKETIVCSDNGQALSISFGFNKKDSSSLMKVYDEDKVILYSGEGNHLVISNMNGLDISILVKMA